MSGQQPPDAPPPEVPEEFAAAYQEAFQRALASGESVGGSHASASEQLLHERVGLYRSSNAWERLTQSRGLLPLVVGALVLVLVGGAYLIGRVLSGEVQPEDAAAEATGSPTPSVESTTNSADDAWTGAVEPLVVEGAHAGCTLPPGRDASGRRVHYEVRNVLDGRPETAWRCAGAARGERLVLRLPGQAEVAELGLIAGYAKTDPADGTDRFAENNRISRVRWHLGEGESFEQELDPDARGLQSLRIPPTKSDHIELEILDVRPGDRNTTAISEISVATVAE